MGLSDLPPDEADRLRVDRSAFSVISPEDRAEDEKAYWRAKTPHERLEALETIRRVLYGHEAATARLQRVLEIGTLSSGDPRHRSCMGGAWKGGPPMEPQDNKQLTLRKAINAHEQAEAALADLSKDPSTSARYAEMVERIQQNLAALQAESDNTSPSAPA